MAAWKRISHMQLDLLDLLRDPLSERKIEHGEGQKGKKKIILRNERTDADATVTISVPLPPTWKFIIRFSSTRGADIHSCMCPAR
jgi:hypothetical protein